MSAFSRSIRVATRRRALVLVTGEVDAVVRASGLTVGICNVFIQHTSASLLITENADPDVHVDLEGFMSDLVEDGDRRFRHTAEGPDDMSAHIRSVLTATSITLPVRAGRLALGTWQGLYVWEHRQSPHSRVLEVSVVG